MKYAVKYLLILVILGMTWTNVLAQEIETKQEMPAETIINVAKFDFKQQSVTINGQEVEQLGDVENKEGVFFIPARFIIEHLLKSYVSVEEDGEVLRIRRQGTLILIKNGEAKAQFDDEIVTLSYPVVITDGHYNISDKDLEILFDMQIEYDEKNEILTVKGEDRRLNESPHADFYFLKNQYMEGDEIVAINTSIDPNQDEIIATRWCVGKENAVIGETLESVLSKPKAGSYDIGLQVQDKRGLWSKWTYKRLKVVENKAPVINELTTDKTIYAPGEEIKFDYSYTNEAGEKITNEKWMYRKSTQEEKLAVLGKPNAFFTPGDYIVTLQIDDTAGKRSKVAEIKVHIEGEAVKSEFEYFFNEGKIGDRIDNFGGYNYREYEDAEIKERSYVEGTLIMSDSPETVEKFGVVYEDTLAGRGRVLIHHLNNISTEKQVTQKLGIIVSNDGKEPVTLTLSNEAIKGPATDITRVGQKVVYDYLTGNKARTLILEPGEKQWIYEQNWDLNHCISGMFDVETDGEVRFIVATLTEDIDLEKIDSVDRLYSDGKHMSGRFENIGLNYTLHLDGSKPTKLLLGDKGSEEWVKGIDTRTGALIENKGNFGVSYYITITAEEDMGIFLNSRGTGIQGAIKWDDGTVYNVPTQGILAQLTTRAAVIGTIKKGETKTFEYILPNGSSAPVLIGFVPASQY